MKTNPLKQPAHLLAAAAALIVLSACAGNRAATPATIAAPAAVAAVPTVAAATEAPKATEASAPTAAPTDASVAATQAPTSEAAQPTATAATAAEAAPAASQSAVYQIDQSQSKATFTLNEKLMGNPKTVVGTSAGVNGQITVDPANPAQSKIGTIEIDATQFATDSGMRDRAIKNFILQTSKAENKLITFEPTAIEGLPAKINAGDAITFKVTGNLTIRNVTKPVTFETTVTQKSETELNGSAKTTVKRSDFQLEIPSVPTVADVTDDVALEFTFVAMKSA